MYEYSEHAELKLKERKILKPEIEEVLSNPDYLFLDVETGNLVAVGNRKYKQGHMLLVVYSHGKVISVIDTSKMDIIKKRVETGRWVKIK